MNKYQKVNFKSVSEFLDHLPEEELEIVEALRNIVAECLPDCHEKLAYNVPFYYGNSRVCYIWPSVIPWGGINEGVALGICQGNLLEKYNHHLSFSNKNTIGTLSFNSLIEINPELVVNILLEAKQIDEEIGRLK